MINAFSKELMKVVMLPELVERYWKGRSVASQAKLNSLWKPPPMHIGEMYASSVKTIALGLVYGPLYPFLYPLTAFALLLCYVCTRQVPLTLCPRALILSPFTPAHLPRYARVPPPCP